MSFVLTYNSLVEKIKNELERKNDPIVLASLDMWIKNAHERIGRDCNSLLFEVSLQGSFQADNCVIQKPNRWQNTIAFNYGTGNGFNTYNPIYLRTYEFCRDYWPDTTQIAPPKFYADYVYGNWLISPTPDQAYPFEIVYLETPQVIDSSFQTNYLTQFMPEILLRATLMEAMITLKNDERIPVISDDYVKLISSWNNKNKLRKFDRYTTRDAD